MPYKTPHGSHYHMTYGCHGATESCDTKGLIPCSTCCGANAGATGTPEGTTGGGTTATGASESRPAHEVTDEMMSELIDHAQVAHRQAMDDLGRDIVMRPGATSMPDPSVGISAEDLANSMAHGAPRAEGPTVAKVIGRGVELMSDGTIRRIPDTKPNSPAQEARDYGNALARRIDERMRILGATPADRDLGRVDVIAQIDAEADTYGNVHDGEQMRLMAQATWNAMHPDYPILEWSKDSTTYAADTPATVMRRHRTYDEMRDVGGSALPTYYYTLHSKKDGSDITQEVSDARNATGRAERALREFDQEARRRAQAEATRRWNEALGQWLRQKGAESDLWKYRHFRQAGRWSQQSVIDEFRRETGMDRQAPDPSPSPEEREIRRGLEEELLAARRRLQEIKDENRLTDEMIDLCNREVTKRIDPQGR